MKKIKNEGKITERSIVIVLDAKDRSNEEVRAVFLVRASSFLRKAQEIYQERLITDKDLEEVFTQVYYSSAYWRGENGSNLFLCKEGDREYKYKATTSVLGVAWVKIETAFHIALVYRRERLKEVKYGYLKGKLINRAAEVLEEHLGENGLTSYLKTVRIGGLIFGGYAFKLGPDWFAFAKFPELRLRRTEDWHLPSWESIRSVQEFIENTSYSVQDILEEHGVKIDRRDVVEIINGEDPGMEDLNTRLNLHFLSLL